MLLKNQKEDTTDYTKDWPARYYDIPTGALRREHLKRAKAEGFAVPADSYREMLCERRFFSEKKDGTVDGFFRAWTMIKASAAAGVSFFQKKRQKKELLTYMKDLWLSPDDLLPESADAVLIEEWQDFARGLISSCTGSKAYCSTLFGFVPIKDAKVAEKLAAEILLVTRDYPALFDLADEFAPFRKVMTDSFCQMIENGETYLQA